LYYYCISIIVGVINVFTIANTISITIIIIKNCL